MTETLNDRRVRYSATASQTNFGVDFPIDADDEITVTQKVDATGVISTLVLTTNYTVVLDGTAPSTAVMTLVTGAAVNDIITIEGDTPVERDSDFTTGGDYFANTINNAEDRQYRIAQERKRDQDRTVEANPVSPDAFNPTLPDTVGNGDKFLGLASDALSLVWSAFVTLGAVVISGSNAQDTGTAAPGTTGDVSDAGHVHAIPTNGIVSAMITALNVTTAKIAAFAVNSAKLKAALIPDFTEVVVTALDSFLLSDQSDSGNNKRDTIQGILDLVTLTKSFTSSNQTITAAGSLTLAHSLSGVPKIVQPYLVCTTTELNYSVNDEVLLSNHQSGDVAGIDTGQSIVSDATNINIRFGATSNTYRILNKTTGVVANATNSSWKLKIRAFI